MFLCYVPWHTYCYHPVVVYCLTTKMITVSCCSRRACCPKVFFAFTVCGLCYITIATEWFSFVVDVMCISVLLPATWSLCDLPGTMACRHFPVPWLSEEHWCWGTSSSRLVLWTVDSRPVYASGGKGWKLDVDVSAWVSRSLWGLGWEVWSSLRTVRICESVFTLVCEYLLMLSTVTTLVFAGIMNLVPFLIKMNLTIS